MKRAAKSVGTPTCAKPGCRKKKQRMGAGEWESWVESQAGRARGIAVLEEMTAEVKKPVLKKTAGAGQIEASVKKHGAVVTTSKPCSSIDMTAPRKDWTALDAAHVAGGVPLDPTDSRSVKPPTVEEDFLEGPGVVEAMLQPRKFPSRDAFEQTREDVNSGAKENIVTSFVVPPGTKDGDTVGNLPPKKGMHPVADVNAGARGAIVARVPAVKSLEAPIPRVDNSAARGVLAKVPRREDQPAPAVVSASSILGRMTAKLPSAPVIVPRGGPLLPPSKKKP